MSCSTHRKTTDGSQIGVKSLLEFLELPDDVLYLIFSRCDIQSLGRLSKVCRRFNRLIKSDSVWLLHSRKYNIIKSVSDAAVTKALLKDQCRISLNWENKVYRERVLLRHNPKQLPWMQYADQHLWISTLNTIKCYKVRNNYGTIVEDARKRLNLQKEDVSRFVVKDDKAVSGCRDGSLYMFDCRTGDRLLDLYKIHNTDAQTVDFHDNCIISGSRDRTIKVISSCYEENSNPIKASVEMNDRVWSVAMAPDGGTFSVGTAGCYGESALSVWDIESCSQIFPLGNFRLGAGTLDLKYETPHTLLSCGYDATVRLWDTRSGQCVYEWEDPFDTTLYCLQSDRDNTIVTGSSRYGMLRLWDKRKSQPVQVYYLGPKNSPVYSVTFDSSRLYAALDLSITMADFSIYPT